MRIYPSRQSQKAPLAVTQVTRPSRMLSAEGKSTFTFGLDLPGAAMPL
jgi:hypothetical protein